MLPRGLALVTSAVECGMRGSWARGGLANAWVGACGRGARELSVSAAPAGGSGSGGAGDGGGAPPRERMEHDLCIVGAGPAGVSAAIRFKQSTEAPAAAGDAAPSSAAPAPAPAAHRGGAPPPAPRRPLPHAHRRGGGAPETLQLLGPAVREPPLPLLAALELVKRTARARFNETVEVHVRLKVDPRRGDQMVRGAAPLPHALGRPPRVAVFAEGAAADEARAAGADVVGGDELVEAIIESKGKSIDFDRAVAHPDMMRALVRAGKVLGPKGLMPNPKVGTLTPDVAAAVREVKRGRVEFKMDRTAIVHAPVGKARMAVAELYANVGALTAALLRAKPAAVKGGLPKYVSKVTVCSTMGRGVEVDAGSLLGAMDAAAAAGGSGA